MWAIVCLVMLGSAGNATAVVGACYSMPDLRGLPYCDSNLTAEARAADLVSRLTLAEKITSMRMTNDASPMNNSGVPRLGVPPLVISECLHSAGQGDERDKLCSGSKCPTSFPSPITLGSAFDASLWRRVAEAVSDEARALRNAGKDGVGLVCWAPVVNLVRDRKQQTLTAQCPSAAFVRLVFKSRDLCAAGAARWGRADESPSEVINSKHTAAAAGSSFC
eukprot:SAG31_NODE_3612_length_4067_cov_13.889617_2_plen_221_part_00